MVAYGYIRKSVMQDQTKTLSPRVQRERIRALAAKLRGRIDAIDLVVEGRRLAPTQMHWRAA